MLQQLHISNYALIDCIDLTLHPGLNIITGETGGGKSIMLGALSLLLGGRADTKSIRRADTKSVIEATFAVETADMLKEFCEAADIDWDPDRMILRREISPNGRSRSFINDTPVNLESLRQVGLHLIDIHSQHQNQLLSDPGFQLDIIDVLADNAARLEEYQTLYTEYRTALRRLRTAKAAIARDRENADFMQYQLQRLDQLALQPDELANLEEDRRQMSEAAEVRQSFDSVLEALSSGEGCAQYLLSRAAGDIADIADRLPAEAKLPERLERLSIELSDISATIENQAAEFPVDATEELEAIDQRISRIKGVMDRHGVDDSNKLLEIADKLRQRLDRLDDADNILSVVERQARQAKKRAIDAATEISNARKAAAEEFGRILHDTAMPLGMKNLVCDIAVEPADLSATGIDRVDFRFAFNKNQQPVAVGASASGGEISRLMLSVKSIIAKRMALPSIIFDEVDTGVSGDVADRMGRMMQSIADNLQVIAITHLPQVAAKGSHHFKVAKHDTDTSTVTEVRELTADERVGELALMLSGDSTNAAARSAATELLNNN